MRVRVQIDCSGWNFTTISFEVFRVYPEFDTTEDPASGWQPHAYPRHTYCVNDARIDWATEELARAGIILTVLGRA